MNPTLRSSVACFLVSFVAFAAPLLTMAQPNSYPYKVAQDRMLWHDNVDKAQQHLVLLGGGRYDSLIRLSKDEAVNLQVTDAFGRRVDEIQQQVEFDSTLNTNNKKRYLRGIADL
ncbi:MAG: hypothetical protein JST68_31490, partial [Bacteroidetes bacterium]|nr:hypothetical protein [Bacteroidota bacterium]